MSKHTSGKWGTEDTRPNGSGIDIISDNDEHTWVATVMGRHNGAPGFPTDEQCDANARLFVVAPELYAACESAEKLIRNGGGVPSQGKTWKQLCAALSKARGES